MLVTTTSRSLARSEVKEFIRHYLDQSQAAAVDARLVPLPDDTLRAPCPSHHTDLCWNADGERFVAEQATVDACAKDLDRLQAKGVEVKRARVAASSPSASRSSLRASLTLPR